MLPTRKQVTQYVAQFSEELRIYGNTRFDLNMSRDAFVVQHGFNICKRLGIAGTKSRGLGKGFYGHMKLNLGELVAYPVNAYSEYASLHGSRRIGGFFTQDWQLWLRALMAHEFAHVVQFMLPHSESRLRSAQFMRYGHYEGLGEHESNHGKFFQAIYAVLREQFVNAHVDRVGWAVKLTQFVHPEGENPHQEKMTARKERAIVNQHPLVGREVFVGGHQFRIEGINTRGRKFPFMATHMVTQKTYKLSVPQVSAGLSAADRALLRSM